MYMLHFVSHISNGPVLSVRLVIPNANTVPFVIPTSTLGPGISPMFDAKTNSAKGLTRLP